MSSKKAMKNPKKSEKCKKKKKKKKNHISSTTTKFLEKNKLNAIISVLPFKEIRLQTELSCPLCFRIQGVTEKKDGQKFLYQISD